MNANLELWIGVVISCSFDIMAKHNFPQPILDSNEKYKIMVKGWTTVHNITAVTKRYSKDSKTT